MNLFSKKAGRNQILKFIIGSNYLGTEIQNSLKIKT